MAYTQQYFVGDTHFGHQLMLQFRPFETTEEMDRFFIDRWNETVAPTDIVWHLGDFGYGDADRTRKIFQQLNGRIRLIIGNHDTDAKGRVHKHLADLAWDQPPVHMAEAHVDGERVTLCHYGMRVWPASHHGAWHFFGHSHGRLPNHGRSRDVGVEKALDVIQAVCRFNWQVCETCEVCAGPSHIIVKEPNGLHQQRLCEHCAEERLAKFEGRSVQ